MRMTAIRIGIEGKIQFLQVKMAEAGQAMEDLGKPAEAGTEEDLLKVSQAVLDALQGVREATRHVDAIGTVALDVMKPFKKFVKSMKNRRDGVEDEQQDFDE